MDLSIPERLSRLDTPLNPQHVLTAIDRRQGLTRRQFKEQYERPRIPVILQDLTIPTHWTPDWWRENYGSTQIPLNAGLEDEEWVALTDFLDYMLEENAASWVPTKDKRPYLRNVHLLQFFPELLPALDGCWSMFAPNWFSPECEPVRFAERLEWMGIPETWQQWAELFMGSHGSRLPFLHYDNFMTAGFAAQLYGCKTYFFWPPHETKAIYPGLNGSSNMSVIRDIHTVNAEEYPEFVRAKPLEVTVQAGEVLWVPPGWWHITRQQEFNISVGGNYLNALNFTDFQAEVREWETRMLEEAAQEEYDSDEEGVPGQQEREDDSD